MNTKDIDNALIDDEIHQIQEEILFIEEHKEILENKIQDLRGQFDLLAINGVKYTTAWGQSCQFIDGKFVLNGEEQDER